MKNRYFIKQGATAVALAMILGISAAHSADVYLQAEQFTKTIADGSGVDGNGTADVTMWGYAECDATFACGAPTSPGPQINVPTGESLTIHLSNALAVPTSIMIAGQANAPLPADATALRIDGRLRSFVPEVDPGAVDTYTWAAPRSGAFLYQSGSHVSLQVHMGLYGAMVMDSVCNPAIPELIAPCAYPDVAYDSREVLVFSEIDPALHDDPVTGLAAPLPANASVTGFVPRFFLINGEPFSGGAAATAAGLSGDDILLSLINAGLENHTPQLLGGNFDVIAEDGRAAPTRRTQHTISLPAGKSRDVLFQPTTHGSYPLFDRGLRTVSDTALNSGMFMNIEVDCNDCVNFADTANATVSYGGGQDADKNATVTNRGFGIQLAGNTWRRTDSEFNIGPNTVLEFTFESGGTVPAEIQGIGFDADDGLTAAQIFQLAGTQSWGNRDFSYSDSGPQTFTIPVGDYYQGPGMHLVFANDHDAGIADSTGSFTNVRIFELVPPPAAPVISDPGAQSARSGSPVQFAVTATDANSDPLTFTTTTVLPAGVTMAADGTFSGTTIVEGMTSVTVTVDDGFGGTDSVSFDLTIVPACADCINFATAATASYIPGGQDVDSDVTVVNSGIGIQLAGNTWRWTDPITYEIGPNTVLEFTFESAGVVAAEIQGIGFDADTTLSAGQIFQLTGTQAWGDSTYSYVVGSKQFFSIPVGTHYQGTGMKLVFVNDHDAAPADVDSTTGTFSDVRVFDVTP